MKLVVQEYVFNQPVCHVKSVFMRSLTGSNSDFSFSYISCHIKVTEPSLPCYFPIAERWIIEFILSPRVCIYSTPPPWAGCDTGSIFLSEIQLVWIQCFSSSRLFIKPRWNNPVLIFAHTWREKRWMHTRVVPKSSKLNPERRNKPENICSGNTLPFLIKLDKLILISINSWAGEAHTNECDKFKIWVRLRTFSRTTLVRFPRVLVLCWNSNNFV